jgi:hypothetical protein
MRLAPAVPTPGLAGFRAVTERRFNDALHGACTATAFNAATEAAVDLPRIARKILCRIHGTADIVVAKDIAGTDNHENGIPSLMLNHQIFKTEARRKRKSPTFKQFQTACENTLDRV